MEKTKWKGKEVLYFEWLQYIGFTPVNDGVVLKETDEEVLVKFKVFKKWVFKYKPEKIKTAESKVGYCKLINK
jgi:hypothetical protein